MNTCVIHMIGYIECRGNGFNGIEIPNEFLYFNESKKSKVKSDDESNKHFSMVETVSVGFDHACATKGISNKPKCWGLNK